MMFLLIVNNVFMINDVRPSQTRVSSKFHRSWVPRFYNLTIDHVLEITKKKIS